MARIVGALLVGNLSVEVSFAESCHVMNLNQKESTFIRMYITGTKLFVL